jgi:hypothetical protein
MSRSIPLARLFVLALILAVLANASTVQSGSAQFEGGTGVQSKALSPNVPTLVFPKSVVPIHRMIYIWTSVSGATRYQIQIYRAATQILNRGITSAVCVSGTCSFRHDVDLSNASHTWRIRALVGGVWQAYSPWQTFSVSLPVTGFSSPFTSDAVDWVIHKGLWYLEGSNYFTTVGVAAMTSTISHLNDYSTLTYEVRMLRTGCAGCANAITIRGNPTLDAAGWWNTEYTFDYSNSGLFSVWRDSYGTYIPLQDWTSTTAINQGGWNLLEVTANGSTLNFYINSHLVWSGIDSAYPSGRVGIGMYRTATSPGDKLYVDYAQLDEFVADPLTADMPVVEMDDVVPGGDRNMAP